MPSFGTLSPQGSRPAFALRVLVPSPDAHFLSPVKLPRKSARGCFREPGEDMCLPLAQGERRRNRRKLLLHLLRAEAAASSLLLALPQAAAPRRPEATKLAFPTPAQMRNAQDWGSLQKSAPGARVPEPRSRRGAGLRAEQRQPPAARGRCARRRAPGTSAGSFLSELQFQCMPRLQHPLRPPPATTFNSPGGLRGSPAGGQRDSGCSREGGAQERRLPQCASSFLGKERAALSSRSPRDCSLDVTPHPPTHTLPAVERRGGWGAGSEDAGV